MTLRARKTLFYGLLALFFIAGTAAVLYAQGWRFDIFTFKTEKVGAIYVRSYPSSAQISLNRKPIENKSGFLSRGTLISDLFPQEYALALSAPAYDAWTESARVLPTLVTEMKYAVLVPSHASSAAAAANVNDFLELGGNVVTIDASGVIAASREPGFGHPAAATTTVIGHGAVVSHSADLSEILIKSPAGTYAVYDLSNSTSTSLAPLLAKASIAAKSITSIAIDPYDGNTIIVQTPSRLATLGLRARAAAALQTASAGQSIEAPLAISSSWIAWARYNNASDTSQIVVYDTFSGNIVDASLAVQGHVRQLGWIRSTLLGVLQEDGTLSQYDVPSETLGKTADDVKSFFPSPDGSMLAALENRSVEVFSLVTSDEYYRFDLPDIGSVQSLAWYRDNAHLFVQYPDRVSFLDLADLGLRNFTTVSSGASSWYDEQQNALYLIDQGKRLIRFDFPS